jgi:putative membrane protein
MSLGFPLAAYDPRPHPWQEWQEQLPLNGWELLLIVVLAGLVIYFAIHRREGGQAQKTSMELLKQRYARGEITQDQFYQMKKDIERGARQERH